MTTTLPWGASSKPFQWPSAPYKGLNYYSAEDYPLLAGRDDDIVLCARSVGDHLTRLLLLHGLTGCGKSSFVRAGLIPYLEGAAGGFQFLREIDPAVSRALFIRSTHAPMQQLARAVYTFASSAAEVRTPRGFRSIDLSPALMGHTDLESFCIDVSEKAERMQNALNLLGERLPRTLVFVVDQGEEVLTLRPGESGARYRSEFFQFLGALTNTDFDLRIVITLRTEYYGRFRHVLQTSGADPAHVRDFYLPTLDHAGLVKAIERPTLNEPVGSFGIPRQHYRFAFDEHLAARIAQDLEAASPAGGILPVMQIVCGRLYEETRQPDEWRITERDYTRLGGVSAQVRAHLDEALSLALFRLAPQLTPMAHLFERERWRHVLFDLVRLQVDGSVTTELLTEGEMLEHARKAGCKTGLPPMMEVLTTDEQRVCRADRGDAQRRRLACVLFAWTRCNRACAAAMV